MTKSYLAVFWRGNPQLKNGGYETTREIKAKTMESARKKARAYEKPIYGTMELMGIYEKEEQ